MQTISRPSICTFDLKYFADFLPERSCDFGTAKIGVPDFAGILIANLLVFSMTVSGMHKLLPLLLQRSVLPVCMHG